MALVSITAQGTTVKSRDGTEAGATLYRALDPLPPGAPVVILVHGYRFSPHLPAHDPHTHILAERPERACRKALSWPSALGLAGPKAAGLAIGFGWHARGYLADAYGAAAAAGAALAKLVAMVRARHAGPVRVLAHSLGARVVLQSLDHLAPGDLDRAVFLAAAEVRGPAEAAMAGAAGRACEFVNVTSRENDLFDFLLERRLGAAPGAALGQGLGASLPGWVDLALDYGAHLDSLAGLGHAVPPPARIVCHWSLYLRPGVFGLYRALLTDPAPIPLLVLRARLPEVAPRRWSRLLSWPAPATGLPSAAQPSS